MSVCPEHQNVSMPRASERQYAKLPKRLQIAQEAAKHIKLFYNSTILQFLRQIAQEA